MEQNAVAANGIETLFPSDDEENDLRRYGATQDTVAPGPKIRPGSKEADDEILDGQSGNKSTSHLLPSQRYNTQESQNATETHVSTRSYSENVSWYHHPKVRENWKVVLGAFMLTVIGLVLFLVGLGVLISPSRGLQCLVFFIGGLLCLIPGAYHLVYIYLAVRGFEGYSLYNLPVFS